MKRYKLGKPSKYQSAKSLEGSSLCNVCSIKGITNRKFSPTRHWYVLFLNMCLHDVIHAEKDR